jgi:hypothetical protein
MEAKGHAGIVAGLSSVAVTGFVRHRVRDMYDPEVTSPPSMTDRLRKRAPMAIAGLGFTGLSTKIAAGFDGWELELVSDTNSEGCDPQFSDLSLTRFGQLGFNRCQPILDIALDAVQGFFDTLP